MTRRGLDSLEELERAEEAAVAEDVNGLVHPDRELLKRVAN